MSKALIQTVLFYSKKFFSLLLSFLLIFSYGSLSVYVIAPIYDFPIPTAFTGQQWFNPYSSIAVSDVGEQKQNNTLWQKCNFHAHSHAWSGLTDGNNELSVIDSVYQHLGYTAFTLSNYFSTDSLPSRNGSLYIPTYEHGFSIQKTHRIVIGAKSVDWFDGIFPQSIHIKQYINTRLIPTCDALILAHPSFGRPSYYHDDFRFLTNYTGVEVFNHYRTSKHHWDSALSNGKAVWVIGNDDTHNATKEGETGVCWTMIQTTSNTRNSIVSAIKAGRTIAVKGTRARMESELQSSIVYGDSIASIKFSAPVDSIRWIGQHGIHLSTTVQSDSSSLNLALLSANCGYVRCEVFTPNTEMLLNPFIRNTSHSIAPQQLQPSVNIYKTTVLRVIYILFPLVFCVYYYRRRIQKRYNSNH